MINRTDIIIGLSALAAIGAGLALQLTKPAGPTTACPQPGATHQLQLAGGAFTPASLTLHRCDQIVILNNDTQPYHVAIGSHDRHVEYPGFYENTIPPGGRYRFIASQTGTYQLHDHLRDQAQATLQVTP